MVPVLVFSAQLAVVITQSPIPAVGTIAAATLDSLGTTAAATSAPASVGAASAAASDVTFFESPQPPANPSSPPISNTQAKRMPHDTPRSTVSGSPATRRGGGARLPAPPAARA